MPLSPLEGRLRPVVAIVQARMTSTRLPGKVMMEICGKPVIHHVAGRLRRSSLIDKVTVATTTEATDDVIGKWCAEAGIDCHRGSLEDVLDRFYHAAKKTGAGTIVRITADCPLIDPGIVDIVIEEYARTGCDYAVTDSTLPDGLDAEVFSFDALERAHREARLSSEREHVTPYIWKRPDVFSVYRVAGGRDLSHMRWTVDDERDFLFVTKIFEGFGCTGRVFAMGEILSYLEKNPGLLSINSGTMRNEGYAKSLRDDKPITDEVRG